MIQNCPVCGKAFDVLWPQLWRYKRRNIYLCSYGCMRTFDREESKMEAKKRDRVAVLQDVVAMIRKEEDPIAYLKGLGYMNPAQAYSDLRKMAKMKAPDLFTQLPEDLKVWKREHMIKTQVKPEPSLADAMTGMQDAADKFFGACEDMGLKLEPEEPVPTEPDDFDDRTTTTAIRVDGLGEFYHDKKYNSVDWRTEAGDEVSMAPWSWGQLADDLPRILKRLGVDTCSE